MSPAPQRPAPRPGVTDERPVPRPGVADAAVLDVLADPTRRRVLDLLARRGPAGPTALARELPVTRQAVAQHLAVLAAAGVVAAQRSGRTVRYTIRREPLAAAAAWLTGLGTAPDTG